VSVGLLFVFFIMVINTMLLVILQPMMTASVTHKCFCFRHLAGRLIISKKYSRIPVMRHLTVSIPITMDANG
jgi:hypothetical protein